MKGRSGVWRTSWSATPVGVLDGRLLPAAAMDAADLLAW